MAPEARAALAEWRVGPDPALAAPADLQVNETFTLDGDVARVDVDARESPAIASVEIGDLAVPFKFAERAGARGDIYTKKLLRHSLRRWTWLVDLLAAEQRRRPVSRHDARRATTKFEYFDSSGGAFTPYVHATGRERRGARRPAATGGLPVSSLRSQPQGDGPRHLHASASSGRRTWPASATSSIRRASSTRPSRPAWSCRSDLPANISLRSRNAITRDRAGVSGQHAGLRPWPAEARTSIACASPGSARTC